MESVESSSSVTFRVTFKGDTETFRLPLDARLEELSLLLYSSFGAVPSTQKLLPRKTLSSQPSGSDALANADVLPTSRPEAAAKGKAAILKLSGDGTPDLLLSEAGIVEGLNFNLLASTDAELNYVASLRDDPLLRGLEDEEELERRRRDRSSDPSKPPVAALNGFGFGDFRTLKPADVGLTSLHPSPEEALRIMYTLATDIGIVTVMKKYKWRVGIMTEMPPVGKVGVSPRCVLGFNVNRGQEISLRLRTDDLKGFRKYEVIRSTLLHELAHMVFDEHDNNFKTLNSKLVRESHVSGHRIEAGHAAAGFSYSSLKASLPQVYRVGGSAYAPFDHRAAAAVAALSRQATHPNGEAEQQEVDPSQAEGALSPQDLAHSCDAGLNDPAREILHHHDGSSETASLEHDKVEAGSRDLQDGSDGLVYRAQMSEKDVVADASSPMVVDQKAEEQHAPHESHATAEQGSENQVPLVQSESVSMDDGECIHATKPAAAGAGSEVEPDLIDLPGDVSAAARSGMDAHSRIRRALDKLDREVQESGCEVAVKAVVTLRTILRNVLEHPADERYRTIRKANRKIQETLCRFPSALELLRIAGFKDGESGTGEVMHCRTPDPGLLWLACAMLDESGLLSGAA